MWWFSDSCGGVQLGTIDYLSRWRRGRRELKSKAWMRVVR